VFTFSTQKNTEKKYARPPKHYNFGYNTTLRPPPMHNIVSGSSLCFAQNSNILFERENMNTALEIEIYSKQKSLNNAFDIIKDQSQAKLSG